MFMGAGLLRREIARRRSPRLRPLKRRERVSMSWFKRDDGDYEGPEPPDSGDRTVRTEGLWVKCPSCRAVIFKADLEANLNVCPKCQHHFKIGARQRIDLLLEPGYELVDGGLRSTDPLNFTDVKSYKQRLRK